MKIVRKLLRLLPFFVLLYLFISTILCYKENVHLLLESGDYSYVDIMTAFSDNVYEFYSATGYNFFDFLGFQSGLNAIISHWNVEATSLCFPNLVTSILLYELFCSLMFLMFDVFNFMITIASNWLRKGESLNE